MTSTAQATRNTPEVRFLERLAAELSEHGWHGELCGGHAPSLLVVNPEDSGLKDRVVCRLRDDGWHFALHCHKTRTLGSVDHVADVAKRLMSILGQVGQETQAELRS